MGKNISFYSPKFFNRLFRSSVTFFQVPDMFILLKQIKQMKSIKNNKFFSKWQIYVMGKPYRPLILMHCFHGCNGFLVHLTPNKIPSHTGVLCFCLIVCCVVPIFASFWPPLDYLTTDYPYGHSKYNSCIKLRQHKGVVDGKDITITHEITIEQNSW